MPSRVSNSSAGGRVLDRLSIQGGGTEAKDYTTALNKLGGFSRDHVGEPDNLIPLDNGKIDAQYIRDVNISNISIDGPLQLPINETAIYFITNYNSFANYTASCTVGEVKLNEGFVEYTAPPIPGNCGFTVNDRFFEIVATGSAIQRPIIIDPAVNQEVGIDYVFRASTYRVLNTPEPHTESDWEISDTPDFSNILYSSYGKTQLTTWTQSDIEVDKILFIRVRYRSENLTSLWSEAVSFRSFTSRIIKPTVSGIVIPGFPNHSLAVTSSAFEYIGTGTEQHISTDWQVATDISFTNIVGSATEDSVNKLSYTFNNLTPSTMFYFRSRYHGVNKISSWSDTVNITTPASTHLITYDLIAGGGGGGYGGIATNTTVQGGGGGGGGSGQDFSESISISQGTVIQFVLGEGGSYASDGYDSIISLPGYTKSVYGGKRGASSTGNQPLDNSTTRYGGDIGGADSINNNGGDGGNNLGSGAKFDGDTPTAALDGILPGSGGGGGAGMKWFKDIDNVDYSQGPVSPGKGKAGAAVVTSSVAAEAYSGFTETYENNKYVYRSNRSGICSINF